MKLAIPFFSRLSLVAVGGYGRGVLAPFSDLDLLFVRSGRPTPRGEQVVGHVLHVLWDLGLKVGSAFRSTWCSRRSARASTSSPG